MEAYTFTPDTTLSKRTAPTSASSGGESVFTRLYRGGSPGDSSWSTPHKTVNPSRCTEQTVLSRTASKSSSNNRMEDYYKKHVEKLRSRPLTEQAEKQLRDSNFEAKEMSECTFAPTTYWGKKKREKSMSTKRSRIIMEPTPVRQRGSIRQETAAERHQPKKERITTAVPASMTQKKGHPPLPTEIVVTVFRNDACREHPWESPMRQVKQRQDAAKNKLISPLHEPLLDGFELIAARNTPQKDKDLFPMLWTQLPK